jgi:hypothetical protein
LKQFDLLVVAQTSAPPHHLLRSDLQPEGEFSLLICYRCGDSRLIAQCLVVGRAVRSAQRTRWGLVHAAPAAPATDACSPDQLVARGSGVDSDFGPTLCRVVGCLPRPAAALILNPLGKLGRRLFDRMRGSKSMTKIKVAQPVVELDGDERPDHLELYREQADPAVSRRRPEIFRPRHEKP